MGSGYQENKFLQLWGPSQALPSAQTKSQFSGEKTGIEIFTRPRGRGGKFRNHQCKGRMDRTRVWGSWVQAQRFLSGSQWMCRLLSPAKEPNNATRCPLLHQVLPMTILQWCSIFESPEVLLLEHLPRFLPPWAFPYLPWRGNPTLSSLTLFSIVSEVMEVTLGNVCSWHSARGSPWLWAPLSRLRDTTPPLSPNEQDPKRQAQVWVA